MSFLANQLKNLPIREASATLQVLEDGAIVTKAVTVKYKSYTVKQLREQQTLFNTKREAGETVFISDTLIQRVTELIEADGTVVEVTQDLLAEMDIENLKAIEKAIDGDSNPK